MNVLQDYTLKYENPKQPHKSIYSTLASRRASRRANTITNNLSAAHEVAVKSVGRKITCRGQEKCPSLEGLLL